MELSPFQLERLKGLEYCIIAGRCRRDASQEEIDLNNRAFAYWKAFWSEVYGKAGTPESLVCDDFLRQDMIALLVHRKQVVGMHLYSFFNLRQAAVKNHRYFQFYPERFFEYMSEKKTDEVMSFEFLTVDPTWRKKNAGISLAEILIACGEKCMLTQGINAGIAPARTDNKVNQMCYNIGTECFQSDLVKRNFHVDLVVGFADQLKPNPEPEIDHQADRLWAQRQDFTRLTWTERDIRKAA